MAFCFPPVVNQRLAFEKPLAKLSRALSRRRSAQRRRRRGSDEVGNAARKVVLSLFFFQSSVIVEQSAERFQTGKEEREEEEARVRKTGPPRPLSSPLLTTLAPRRRRCLPRPAETRTCEGAVAEKERERRKAAERANRTGEEKRFQMHSSSSSRFSLSLPLLPIRRGKPYLRPYVLGGLLGGSAVVGVHGLELALGPGALPLFAVLVLRRHRPALFVLLFDRQRRSAPALLLRGSVRGGGLSAFRALADASGFGALWVRVARAEESERQRRKEKSEREKPRTTSSRRKETHHTRNLDGDDDDADGPIRLRPRASRTSMAPSQALACLEITRDIRVPPLEKFIALRRLQR